MLCLLSGVGAGGCFGVCRLRGSLLTFKQVVPEAQHPIAFSKHGAVEPLSGGVGPASTRRLIVAGGVP